MRLVFFDTVGLIALWDESDQWHGAAAEAYDRLKREPFTAVTSPLVLLECANAAARRPYRSLLVELRIRLMAANMIVVPTDEEAEAAWRLYEHGQPGSVAVVDLMSFQIMRRLGVTDAFTNDRHFKVAGFSPLF